MVNEILNPLSAAQEILKRQYARTVFPECDGTYRAEILEFPGCLAVGDTPEEALSSLEAVAESWLESALAKGLAIPEPMAETEYSGKLMLRVPKSLHRRAAVAAKFEGVSLNRLIVVALTSHLQAKVEKPVMPQTVSMTAVTNHNVVIATQGSFYTQTSSSDKTITIDDPVGAFSELVKA